MHGKRKPRGTPRGAGALYPAQELVGISEDVVRLEDEHPRVMGAPRRFQQFMELVMPGEPQRGARILLYGDILSVQGRMPEPVERGFS